MILVCFCADFMSRSGFALSHLCAIRGFPGFVDGLFFAASTGYSEGDKAR